MSVEDRIDEAAKEMLRVLYSWVPDYQVDPDDLEDLRPLCQRLYDDGKKAGAEEAAAALRNEASEMHRAGEVRTAEHLAEAARIVTWSMRSKGDEQAEDSLGTF